MFKTTYLKIKNKVKRLYHKIYSANRHIPTIKAVPLKLIIEAHNIDITVPINLCYFIFYETNIDKNIIKIVNDIKHNFLRSISSNLYIGTILSLSKFKELYVILFKYSTILKIKIKRK